MRARRADPDWLVLLVGAVAAVCGAVWAFRVEVVIVLAIVLAHDALASVVESAPAWVLLGSATGVALVVPASRRRVLDVMRAASLRRGWYRALRDCGLPRFSVRKVRRTPAGDRVWLRAPRGWTLGSLVKRAEGLSVCLKLRDLRVARDLENASKGWVVLVRRDPLADMRSAAWPYASAPWLSLWDRVPMGVDELGRTVSVGLPERNVLIGGEPGAGKSVAMSLLVATAALDPSCRLWLLDGKVVELSAWESCAERLAGPDVGEAIELLRQVRDEMEQRYRDLLARGARKITEGDGLPLHVVVCDELAFYLTVEDRKQRTAFTELLRDLVARGRAAGIIVCAATQKPASDVVPSSLRDLFGFRLALRCNTPQASDTILGQGWASQGHNAATIAPGERGIGLLLAEDGRPTRMRGFHLADDDITSIAQRAAAGRAEYAFDVAEDEPVTAEEAEGERGAA